MALPYELIKKSYHVQFPQKPKDRRHLEAVGEIMHRTGFSLLEKQVDFAYLTFLTKSVYKT